MNPDAPSRVGLLQGTLDLLILRTLLTGPAHGHAIAKHIQRTSEDLLQVETGSLYPALHRLEAKGWTNLWDGLEYAMADPEADTVFLYSDGGASKGAFVAAKEILSELAERNRFRRVVIHAVEVPGERNSADNRRLLADLARATGGTSKLAKKEGSR